MESVQVFLKMFNSTVFFVQIYRCCLYTLDTGIHKDSPVLFSVYPSPRVLMSAHEQEFLILMKEKNLQVFFSFVPSDFCMSFKNCCIYPKSVNILSCFFSTGCTNYSSQTVCDLFHINLFEVEIKSLLKKNIDIQLIQNDILNWQSSPQ